MEKEKQVCWCGFDVICVCPLIDHCQQPMKMHAEATLLYKYWYTLSQHCLTMHQLLYKHFCYLWLYTFPIISNVFPPFCLTVGNVCPLSCAPPTLGVGTCTYASPEQLHNENYDSKVPCILTKLFYFMLYIFSFFIQASVFGLFSGWYL